MSAMQAFQWGCGPPCKTAYRPSFLFLKNRPSTAYVHVLAIRRASPAQPLQIIANQEQEPTMSVEIIGMIQSQKQSEIHPASGPVVDRGFVRAFAQAHDNAGFDRVLVPHHSTGPSATLTIAYAAAVTEHVHFM